jgi:DNA mismatch repair ATPase MutS
MKSFLMHRDRDFDPDQSLRNVMYGYRDARAQLEHQLSTHERALIQDLELDVLCHAMANSDEFLFEIARKAIISAVGNDSETIMYRQQTLKDCLNNPGVVRSLYGVAVEATAGTRKMQGGISSYEHPSSLLYGAIDILETLSQKLRNLRLIAEKQTAGFESEPFRTLFAMLQKELGDEYLTNIERHLTELKFHKGVLLSAELDEHNEGTNYMLRRRSKKEPKWLDRILGKRPATYTFYIAQQDMAGGQILSAMRRRGITRVAGTLAQSAEHVLSFFTMLRIELGFYLCCLNLHDRLVAEGSTLCFPAPAAIGGSKYRFHELYDVCLALQMKRSVVANSADAAGKSLVLITGANQGGKSTFLRAVGVAQLMMQAGMYVGAQTFEAELCPALFTHYKREEDPSMKSGKFDEELARMSDIADRLAPHAMVLFNEAFAATNEREGSEIARQVIAALLEKGLRVFYVTHLFTLARTFWDRNREQVLFLRAERNSDGARTFNMIEAEPLETSYGEDLYRQVFEADRREPSEENHHVRSIISI